MFGFKAMKNWGAKVAVPMGHLYGHTCLCAMLLGSQIYSLPGEFWEGVRASARSAGVQHMRTLFEYVVHGLQAVVQAYLALDLVTKCWLAILLVSCSAVGIITHKLMERARRERDFRSLELRTGHFNSNGRMYYREDKEAPLYRVNLKKTKGYAGDGSLISPEYEYSLIGELYFGFSESTLTGAAAVKRIPQSALPAGMVIIFDRENVAGVGFRYGDKLVTARHLVEVVSEMYVQGNKGRVRLDPDFVFVYPPKDEYENTGADIASVELSQNQWSLIGSKAMKRTQFSRRASGLVRVYGADNDGVYESYGHVVADGKEQKESGTISYRVSTFPGFSGSPVFVRTATGTDSVIGMHICGDYTSKNVNHAACATALSMHLTGSKGPGGKVSIDEFLNESSTPKDMQDDFDEWDDLAPAMTKAEWRNRDRDGDQDGHAGGDDHDDTPQSDVSIDWDDEEDHIRDQIYGESAAKKKKKPKNEAVGNNKIQDKIKKRKAEKEAKRVICAIDEHGYPVSDYLYPPGFSGEDKNVVNENARIGVVYDLMTEFCSAARQHAKPCTDFLCGFINGERTWYRCKGDEFPYGQYPSGMTIPDQVEATPEQIRDLFARMYKGDHTALIDATEYTYESMVDQMDTDPMANDLFRAFREYRDHTRKLITEETAACIVMPESTNRPFFRSVAKVAGGDGGKKRKAPLALSDEDKELLRSLGIEGDFVLPPNDEHAIMASMQAQAARQKACRGLPEMEDMLLAWERAIQLNSSDTLREPSAKLTYGAKRLESLFSGFDNTSSGWTRRFKNLDKKTYATKFPRELMQITVARLLARASMVHRISSMTPEELIHYGLKDPIESFIKEEPHSSDKLKKQTWRLISNVSLIDCMCEAYNDDEMNKEQIREYQSGATVSHTSGMGHHDHGIARLGSHIEKLFPSGRVISTDATGWDFSVSRDALVADATQRILRTYKIDDSKQSVGTAISIMCDKMAMSAHAFVTGRNLFASVIYGMTASGAPDTTTQNSFMRGLGANLAGARNTMTAGDDLLTGAPLDNDELARHGTVTKEGMAIADWKKGEPIPFTSHTLVRDANGKWSSTFCNVSKALHRLLLPGIAVTQDQLSGVAFAMRNTKEQIDTLEKVCEAKGWNLPDREAWTWDPEFM